MLPAVIVLAGSALAAAGLLRWFLELRQAETLRRLEAARRCSPMPISSAVRLFLDATEPAPLGGPEKPARFTSHDSSPKAGARDSE